MRYHTVPAPILSAVPRIATRLLLLAFVALAAALAVPSLSARPAHAAGGALTIHATDFSFSLDRQTVTPGPVHIEFFNDSKDFNHEVWVYPADQPKLNDLLAAKRAGKDIDEADYLQGLAGHVEDVPPGQSIAFDVTLSPGTYELACFIRSTIGGQVMVHYDMGMHTTVVAGTEAAPKPAVAAAPAQAPAPAPATANVQAPNTGTGPSSGSSNVIWITAIAAAGVLMLASGGLVRRASRRR